MPTECSHTKCAADANRRRVRPEHIERCLTLTEQFRALPLAHRRKQDMLGVKDIMLHAVSHALSVLGEEEMGGDDRE